MDFIHIGSILIAFWITIALMLCHYYSPIIAKISWLNSRVVTSFSGGVAVAYVFLHMLPDLVEGNVAVGKLLEQNKMLTPLLDLGIFILALVGFNIYYGLELLASRVSKEKPNQKEKIYYLHLLMYCLSNFLITYSMPLRVQTGFLYAVIFTFAIGLHFIFIDRNFNRHFKRYFTHSGRIFLLLALFIGWFISLITDPINMAVISLMIAFLSGSILYNVFREELPTSHNSSFISFTSGILVIMLILVFMTVYALNLTA